MEILNLRRMKNTYLSALPTYVESFGKGTDKFFILFSDFLEVLGNPRIFSLGNEDEQFLRNQGVSELHW